MSRAASFQWKQSPLSAQGQRVTLRLAEGMQRTLRALYIQLPRESHASKQEAACVMAWAPCFSFDMKTEQAVVQHETWQADLVEDRLSRSHQETLYSDPGWRSCKGSVAPYV